MITHFIGADGPTINVESVTELYEAMDYLETQIRKNLPDNLVYKPDLVRLLMETKETIDVIRWHQPMQERS